MDVIGRAGGCLRYGLGKRRDLTLELAWCGKVALQYGGKDRQFIQLQRGFILGIPIRRQNMRPDPRLAKRRVQSATDAVRKRLCEIRSQSRARLNNKRYIYDGRAI